MTLLKVYLVWTSNDCVQQIYTYVGAVDVEACNLPTGIYFPIPYARLSLLTYPGIAVTALIAIGIRDYFNRKNRLRGRLVG